MSLTLVMKEDKTEVTGASSLVLFSEKSFFSVQQSIGYKPTVTPEVGSVTSSVDVSSL